MANVEKLSVALTPEMAAMLRHAVASGEYASASEVMREALRDWKARRIEREKAVEEIGRLWDIGVSSGVSTEGEEAFARIRAALAREVTDAARR